jgi:hypothetical protein
MCNLKRPLSLLDFYRLFILGKLAELALLCDFGRAVLDPAECLLFMHGSILMHALNKIPAIGINSNGSVDGI